MILYHGTDLDSALAILNHGLDGSKLNKLQTGRPTQIGIGWYSATEPEAAWFFASLAPGNQDKGFTVIELEISDVTIKQLVASGQVMVTDIRNVPFVAKQVWFDINTFATVNREGVFRPCRNKEGFND
ncbi:MAG: hypothetical protein R2867_13040 [Caldilineaceae bacterium]